MTTNLTVAFNFSHGNDGGMYTCFLRDADRCPPSEQTISCQQGMAVSFTAQPDVWYSCGVNCRLGNVRRSIRRAFSTPAAADDCVVIFINDGISFGNYNLTHADVTFEWSSVGTHSGFTCSIDQGLTSSCEDYILILS